MFCLFFLEAELALNFPDDLSLGADGKITVCKHFIIRLCNTINSCWHMLCLLLIVTVQQS